LRSLEIKGQDLLAEAPAWTGISDPSAFIARYLAAEPTDDRIWRVLAALRRGATVDAIHDATRIDRWFLRKLRNVVRFAADELHGKTPSPTALAERGVQPIMINSNPETVSTDFDASARLYFEPLDEESVANVLANEGGDVAVLAQFGGQTALNLADKIERMGGHISGTSADAIGLAEDRRRFHEFATALGIPQPPGGTAESLSEARAIADEIGYPVLVRPSYVLGGRGMEIAYGPDDLERYFASALEASFGRVLVDKYLRGREVEVDAVSDGSETLVAGIMEHIERAGVHSGDSFAMYPAPNLSAAERDEIVELTRKIASSLPVRGLLNIQFIVEEGRVWCLEVNPRASRTVPFLTKV